MIAMACSMLFGFIAMCAIAAIHASLAQGFRRGRDLQKELEYRRDENAVRHFADSGFRRFQPEPMLLRAVP